MFSLGVTHLYCFNEWGLPVSRFYSHSHTVLFSSLLSTNASGTPMLVGVSVACNWPGQHDVWKAEHTAQTLWALPWFSLDTSLAPLYFLGCHSHFKPFVGSWAVFIWLCFSVISVLLLSSSTYELPMKQLWLSSLAIKEVWDLWNSVSYCLRVLKMLSNTCSCEILEMCFHVLILIQYCVTSFMHVLRM